MSTKETKVAKKQIPKEQAQEEKSRLEPAFDFEFENVPEKVVPEVKSYIYQTISEFAPYSTPQTIITVMARDPMELASRIESENDLDLPNPKLLKKMFRIAISIGEEGAQLEEEGLHKDIFVAIKIAKDNLLKTLSEMQDEVMSSQDRAAQISDVLGGNQVH